MIRSTGGSQFVRRDLNAARILVSTEPGASVFHSQQAAEKSEKALLTFHGVPFRKTHDLKELGQQCLAVAPSLAEILEEASALTEYASLFRYDNSPRDPNTEEAEAALDTARRLHEGVRAHLLTYFTLA